MRKLKIAQIAPFWFDVPPKDYGGTERVVSYITEELVRRGHNVTLFATEGSETKAKLVSPLASSFLKYIETYCDTHFSVINTYINSYAFQRAHEFDIIHSHTSYFSFYFCDFVKTPVIHTLHNQLPRGREVENELFRKYRHLNFVSISDEFRTHFDLNYIATVYHGLRLDLFPFHPKGGDHLLWIGRASKNKGEVEAIHAAKKAKEKLILGISIRKDSEEYFHTKIQPELNKNITLVRNIRFEDTGKYYGGAKAFIFPVQWAEPFGLILIESMACGTPVIAYGRGSIPEIIEDGKTGYVVDQKEGIDGIVDAIKKLNALPQKDYLMMRKQCRERVEKYFTVEKMVDRYEEVYRKFLKQ